MSGSVEVAKSYTSILAQQWSIYVISLLTFGIIARVLDTHDVGVYGLIVSIIYLFGLSSNFGFKRVSIKIISQLKGIDWVKARKSFWTSILFASISIFVTSVLITYFLKYFKIFSLYACEDLHYILFLTLLILFSFRNHLSLGLEALKEFHVLAVYVGVGFIIYRILMIITILLGYKLLGILASWCIGELTTIILIARKVFDRYTPFNIDFRLYREMGKEAPPIFISDIILSLTDYGDKVLTSIFGFTAVAFFYIASTGAMALGSFAQALYNGLLPHLSEEYSNNNGDGVIHRVKNINRYVYLFISPIYLIGVALSYPFISILVGPGYSQAAAIFQVIALGLWIASIAPINQTMLIAAGRSFYLMIIMLVGVLADFAAIVFLYPFIGVLATGFGKALLLVITFILSTYIIIRKWGEEPFNLSDYIIPTISAVISASVTWLSWIILARLDLIIINIGIGVILYLYLLRLFKAIKAEEIATLYMELPFKNRLKTMLKIICYITGVEYNKVLEMIE